MSRPLRLTGLTWDHPRAYIGLVAETARFNATQAEIELVWKRHSLRGFETTPIAETASRHDLIVLDHPFMGDAARSGALVDLAEQTDPQSLSGAYVGPSLESYCYEGLWALPLDAACQTAVMRPDLMKALGAEPSETLDDLVDFAERHPIGLAMACPHAFMNFLSIAGLLGADISGKGARFLAAEVAGEAVALLRRLAHALPQDAFGWSSIGLLEAMATTDAIAYGPLVFCFNTYAHETADPTRRPLAFASPPELVPGREANGVVAGGAGLAISAQTKHPEACLRVVAHFTGEAAQIAMARDGGQPAHRAVWAPDAEPTVNGSFFDDCRLTMEDAVLRPRYPGYMAFQNAAGDLLRADAMAQGKPAAGVVSDLEALYAESREALESR